MGNGVSIHIRPLWEETARSCSMKTFLSPNNPFGFGIGDYVEIFTVLAFIALIGAWVFAPRLSRRIHADSRWWILFFAVFPVGLRLCLLPRSPAPIPSGADDFSYILLADTFRHFRLS